MSMLDNLAGQASKLDIGALAERVGLPREQAEQAVKALLKHLSAGKDEKQAVDDASSETGVAPDKLAALLPQVKEMLGSGGIGKIGGMASGMFGG